jgi:hypothetical protein
MKQFFPLFKYLGIFILLYILLFSVFSIPSVGQVSADVYRATTQPVLQVIFPKAYLKLERDNAADPDPQVIRAVFASKEEIRKQTELARQQGSSRLQMNATSYELFFNLFFSTFFVFLLALIWMTPIDLKSKLWATLSGTILFYLYTVVKVAIFLLDLFNRSAYDMYKLGSFGTNFVEGLANLIRSLGFSSFIVILIWSFVAFRKSDWRKALGRFGQE